MAEAPAEGTPVTPLPPKINANNQHKRDRLSRLNKHDQEDCSRLAQISLQCQTFHPDNRGEACAAQITAYRECQKEQRKRKAEAKLASQQ
jgi:hypothetical protein